MATTALTTFADMVLHLLDYQGAGVTGDVTRDARRAVLNAYRDLASASIWSYFYNRGRMQCNRPFTTGTIQYTQANQTVTLTLPTQNVQGASNSSPILITSNSHDLSTGMQITISGCLGNTAANGTWTIMVVDAINFQLNNSIGNGIWVG